MRRFPSKRLLRSTSTNNRKQNSMTILPFTSAASLGGTNIVVGFRQPPKSTVEIQYSEDGGSTWVAVATSTNNSNNPRNGSEQFDSALGKSPRVVLP